VVRLLARRQQVSGAHDLGGVADRELAADRAAATY
jgi:hypothetical protein